MRTGNTMDGMYLFLLLLPIVIGILTGDYLRRKIISHLVLESFWSQHSSTLVGIVVEFLLIVSCVLAGFLLVKLV
jgi:hypothetical protein